VTLSEFSVLTVQITGSWWTIDEPACSYTIRQEEGGPIEVISRNRQTKGTAAERAANPQYMNVDAYDKLLRSSYPWSLPFNIWASMVRTYLAHIDVNRWRVMESLSPTPKRETILTTETIAYEILGCTSSDAKILVNAASTDPWTLWGLPAAELDATHFILDPADKALKIAEGSWETVLTSRVDVFLRQSGFTYRQLLNLVQLSDVFGVLGSSLSIKARAGANIATCELKLLEINGAAYSQVLVEIARFGRLLHRLKSWSVLNLGKAIRAVRSKIDVTTRFTESGLKSLLTSLSHIVRLQALLPNLSFDAILSLVSVNMDDRQYKDYESAEDDEESSSFYASVFRNRTVSVRPDTIFTGDPATLQGHMLKDVVPTITGALQIGALDLSSLSRAVLGDDPPLTIDTISKLYRHATLAQSLGIAIGDYLRLLRLSPSTDVFQGSGQTILFLERANFVLASPFSLAELSYVLRHEYTVENTPSPQEDAIALMLTDLRSELQRISKENSFTDEMSDQNGDLSQKRLAAAGWDTAVINQAIAAFKDTFVWITTLADPLPASFATFIPEEVRERVSYDDSDLNALRLSFSGVMTRQDQAALKGTELPDAFGKAVDSLFKESRDFFRRNMQTISIPDYSRRVSMPRLVKIPDTINKKIFYDASTDLLHVRGAMTEAERSMLLAGTDTAADEDYIKAVKELFELPDSTPSDAMGDDVFLLETDISDLFDSPQAASGEANTALRRFTMLLQKLLPRLKRLLSQRLITQKLAEFLGMEVQVTSALLHDWMEVTPKTPLMSVFTREDLVGSAPGSIILKRNFQDQFDSLVRLAKVSTLIQKLKFTKNQLRWIFEFRRESGDPTAQWLDFNALPSSLVEKGDFEGWERIVNLASLRDKLHLGEQTLDAIFAKARTEIAPTPSEHMTGVYEEVARRTDWALEDVTRLAEADTLNCGTPVAFQDEIALTRIQAALGTVRKIGCTVDEAVEYAKPEQTERNGRSIVQTVKSKYDSTLWQTVAHPLRNILREEQTCQPSLLHARESATKAQNYLAKRQ
jgi:hypothetical protein